MAVQCLLHHLVVELLIFTDYYRSYGFCQILRRQLHIPSRPEQKQSTLITIDYNLDWLLSDEVFASNIQKKYLSVRSHVNTLLKFDECQGDFTSLIISEDIFADNDGLIPAVTALDALTRWFVEGRMCWNCHGWENLLKCSGCKKARYCGVVCQESDWERHGGYCRSRQEKRKMKLGATGVSNPK